MNTRQAQIERITRDIQRRIDRVKRDQKEGQITVDEIYLVLESVAKKMAMIDKLKQTI